MNKIHHELSGGSHNQKRKQKSSNFCKPNTTSYVQYSNFNKNEKIKMKIYILIGISLFFINITSAQDNITIVAPTSQAADGLNLQAVSGLFTEMKNLEDFERALNDPDEGINNLDLDGNGMVDYIRIVEEVANNTHLIILQAATGKDEFQDVATIEVEKTGDSYNMQVRGNMLVYGKSYYYHPVYVGTWPILSWIYRPVYRPYHSRFYFGSYPRWWRPFQPLRVSVYHKKIHRYTHRNTFVAAKKNRMKTIHKMKYKPRHSTVVTKRVMGKNNNHTGKKSVTMKKTVNHKNGTKTKTVKKTKATKKGTKVKVKRTKVKKRN